MSMAQRTPTQKSRITALFNPFSLQGWLIIVATLSVVTLIFKLLISRAKNFEIIFAIFFLESVSLTTDYKSNFARKLSWRLFIGSWTLSSMIIIMAYSSMLKSSLTIPEFNTGINSFEELVKNHRFRLGLHQDEDGYEYKFLVNHTLNIFILNRHCFILCLLPKMS